MKIEEKILKKIEESEKIVITGHVNPDGDAVGSGLALYIALRKKYINKEISFILQDKIPQNTKFLSYADEIEQFDNLKQYDKDLIIFVDSATRERTGKVGEYFKNIYSINIDHHISNPLYGDLNLVKAVSSSTSEIMFDLINELQLELDIDSASSLYLGIVNDTGNFSHSNVSVNTMKVATKLIELGVNNNYIVKNFLNSNSMSALKVLGDALVNFEFFEDISLSFYYLDLKTQKNLKIKKEDTEGLVEKILSYEKAEVSLFLRQEDEKYIKGSMRSKNEIDVNKIANIFAGGGHIKAAGFTSDKKVDEILEIIKKYLQNI